MIKDVLWRVRECNCYVFGMMSWTWTTASIMTGQLAISVYKKIMKLNLDVTVDNPDCRAHAQIWQPLSLLPFQCMGRQNKDMADPPFIFTPPSALCPWLSREG